MCRWCILGHWFLWQSVELLSGDHGLSLKSVADHASWLFPDDVLDHNSITNMSSIADQETELCLGIWVSCCGSASLADVSGHDLLTHPRVLK